MTNYITSVGVQQFTITIASGSTTGTAGVTGVGSGAYINYGGINPSIAATLTEDFARLSFTSPTVTATRNTGAARHGGGQRQPHRWRYDESRQRACSTAPRR